ncbi:hypothetical protein ACFV0T_26365 [Streptomyces sp. NPDC059582]|uniref:hypothetical protein n=1 Tax=Streptomyces sp. NPDC059582 TaxID=3346875 RepID=UPI0036852A11
MTSDAAQDSRVAALADQLSREYDYRGIAELEQEDPERAQEHRDAAQALLSWIVECPREERQAAFWRGYDKGRERQKARTAEDIQRLEADVAELRQDRDPEALRARIADLQYLNRGWERRMRGTTAGQSETADLLRRLEAAQRELAELKGVQPSNATGLRPS